MGKGAVRWNAWGITQGHLNEVPQLWVATAILLLLLLKGSILLEGQKQRKDRKTWKSRSEEKVVGFSSASLFPARKQEAVIRGGTM